MSLPKYPHYKPSGVQWLGDVPAHWGKSTLKRIGLIRYGIGEPPPYKIDGIPLIRATNVSSGRIIPENLVFVDPADIPKQRIVWLKTGDIVVVRSGAYTGDSGLIDENYDGAIAGFDMVFSVKSCFSSFVSYSLQSRYLKDHQIDLKKTRAAQPHLNAEELGECIFLLPPIQEQEHIAAFLDHETAKIDALIAEQEKLIHLLAEKRQATISHAVTRGLDPAAPMKDSGVAWLGEVPAHWEVGAVKRFFRSLDGRRVPLSAEERGGRQGEFPYYGASGVIDSIDDFIFDEDLVLVSEDGANLLNRSSPIAFVATGKYWVNNHAHILKPTDENVRFWAERIEVIDLEPVVTGAAQPKLTIEALMNLPISAPPTNEERAAIGTFIDAETTRLDTLRAEAERAIALLKERRAALIAAAVTGQIDVRQNSEILNGGESRDAVAALS
jgi:type I restriction enzyme S subunit